MRGTTCTSQHLPCGWRYLKKSLRRKELKWHKRVHGLFPDSVLQGICGLSGYSHKPLRDLGQLSKIGPSPLMTCEIPSCCAGGNLRHILLTRPHFTLLFTLQKQYKLIVNSASSSKDYRRPSEIPLSHVPWTFYMLLQTLYIHHWFLFKKQNKKLCVTYYLATSFFSPLKTV